MKKVSKERDGEGEGIFCIQMAFNSPLGEIKD